MTLTTHIIIATAISKPFFAANPELVFFIAAASHYLSDAIPHWDYRLGAVRQKEGGNIGEHEILRDKNLIITDLFKIAGDIALGSAIVYLAVQPEHTIAGLLPLAIAVAGAVLPDSLQPVYWLGGRWPITWMHRFHTFMHAKIRLGRDQWADSKFVVIGKISQLALLFAALFVAAL